MPHADSSLVPESITTRHQFWEHVHEQLVHLLGDQRAWVSNLANAASLIYNSLLAFPLFFGSGENAVNWCGFYVHASYFPHPRNHPTTDHTPSSPDTLLLGPFCGKPACQLINVSPTNSRGVCADAYLQRSTKLIPDVGAYLGHIACDAETRSELVIPLVLDDRRGANQEALIFRLLLRSDEDGKTNVPGVQVSDTPDGHTVVGVLDLDCLALSGFQEEDRLGLERIARLIIHSCDW